MFYVVTAFAAIVALVTPFTMDRVPAKHAHARLDVPSVVLSTLGFGSLLYSFSIIGNGGFGIEFFVSLIVGLVVIVLFFRRQLSMEHPMLRVRVLGQQDLLDGHDHRYGRAGGAPFRGYLAAYLSAIVAWLFCHRIWSRTLTRCAHHGHHGPDRRALVRPPRAARGSLLPARSCSRSARSCSPS